jgi:hypothetical protein
MWASDPADSHLLSAAALRAVILASGFVERYWHAAIRVPEPAPSPGPPVPSIQHLIMGERLAAIQAARTRNQAEDRLHTVLAVFERP